MARRKESKAAFVSSPPANGRSPAEKIVVRRNWGLNALLKRALKRHVSPERLNKFVRVLFNKAAKGSSPYAAKLIESLEGPIAIATYEGIMRYVNAPVGGVTSPQDKTIPGLSSLKVRKYAGTNNLIQGHEHKYKFTAGKDYGRWMKSLKRDNGEVKLKYLDTTEALGFQSSDRGELITDFGFNQKKQIFISTNLFGFENNQVRSLFSMDTFDSSQVRDQIAYGALGNMISKATITSLNRYVPTYVRLNFCKLKIIGTNFENTMLPLVNTNLSTSKDGAMPLYTQQSESTVTDFLGTSIFVDPKSRGVRAANTFGETVEIVHSKVIKLGAGDRLKLEYNHKSPSGIRLDKLHGMERLPSYSADCPLTYVLMVELWGEEVDCHRALNGYVVKGTAPGIVQFEFEKRFVGVRPAAIAANIQNSGSFGGYLSTDFAIKVYTKTPLASNTRRVFDTYANLNSAYTIPLMSDAFNVDAGQIS